MAFVKVKVLMDRGNFGKRLVNLDNVLYIDILKYVHEEKSKDKDVEERFKKIDGTEMLFFVTGLTVENEESGFWGQATGEDIIAKLEELNLLTKKKDGV